MNDKLKGLGPALDRADAGSERMAQRRQFMRNLVGVGLWSSVGGAGLFAPLVHALDMAKTQMPANKSIHDMRGDVKVDGQKATYDTFISASSLVETGSNSYVIFVVGKDAHILRENSKVQLSGAKKATVAVNSSDDTLEDGLNLASGKLLSVFGKRNEGESHTIRTSTATIGIRGTGVYTESEPDVSYVCTCYGIVDLLASKDSESKERIISRHHDAPRYVLADGKKSSLIEPAPFKNHSDEELMLIESLVGRVPPLSNVKGYRTPRKNY